MIFSLLTISSYPSLLFTGPVHFYSPATVSFLVAKLRDSHALPVSVVNYYLISLKERVEDHSLLFNSANKQFGLSATLIAPPLTTIIDHVLSSSDPASNGASITALLLVELLAKSYTRNEEHIKHLDESWIPVLMHHSNTSSENTSW